MTDQSEAQITNPHGSQGFYLISNPCSDDDAIVTEEDLSISNNNIRLTKQSKSEFSTPTKNL